MTREIIADLTFIRGTETFSFKADGIERNLKDFILDFPSVHYKRGVWNSYTPMETKQAIDKVNKSGYGADVILEYDDRWENGYADGVCKVYLSCPCDSDMW